MINGEAITDTNNKAKKIVNILLILDISPNINIPKIIKVEDFVTSTKNCTFQFHKIDVLFYSKSNK